MEEFDRISGYDFTQKRAGYGTAHLAGLGKLGVTIHRRSFGAVKSICEDCVMLFYIDIDEYLYKVGLMDTGYQWGSRKINLPPTIEFWLR